MLTAEQIRVLLFLIEMLALLGIVFLVVSAIIAVWRKRRKSRCTLKVTATVEENCRRNLSEPVFPNVGEADLMSWFPVFAYEVAGKRYLVVSEVGDRKQAYAVGQQVELFVDPNNLESIFDPAAKSAPIALIFAIIGVVLLFIAIVLSLFVGYVFLGSVAYLFTDGLRELSLLA